jgi:hypothetical protein
VGRNPLADRVLQEPGLDLESRPGIASVSPLHVLSQSCLEATTRSCTRLTARRDGGGEEPFSVVAKGSSFWCARHALCLGGESPPRALVTGTASRSKGVRREAESEGSVRRSVDSTNRNRIEGRRSWVSWPNTTKPGSHSESCEGRSGECHGKEIGLTLGDVCHCPDEPDYRAGDSQGREQTSQQTP